MDKPFETDVDLEIEGFELARGQRVRKRLPSVELVDGTWVELPVEVVRGAKPGPVLYLGAAFHGDALGIEYAYQGFDSFGAAHRLGISWR